MYEISNECNTLGLPASENEGVTNPVCRHQDKILRNVQALIPVCQAISAGVSVEDIIVTSLFCSGEIYR